MEAYTRTDMAISSTSETIHTRYKVGKDWVENIYSTPTTYQSLQKSQTTLRDIMSEEGDFVNPTPHRFTKTEMHLMYTAQIERTETIFGADGAYTSKTIRYTGPTGEQALGGSLPDQMSFAYNAALEKFNAKLRGGVDLSVSVAQAGLITKMIKAAVKCTNFIKRVSTVKGWAGTWLEWVYGWKPLASDLYGSIEQLYNRVGGALLLEGKATNLQERNDVTDGGDWSAKINLRRSDRCHFKALWTPSNGYLDLAARLTSLNPLSIAWEVLPFSFVIDWFVDIGGFIRNAETALVMPGALKSAFVVKTSRTIASYSATGRTRPGTPSYFKVTTSGSKRSRHVNSTYDRSVLTSLPYPMRPKFRADLGGLRLVNAAALILSIFSRR